MLRISRLEEDGTITLFLEGKLLAPWIEEVETALAADPPPSRLNLRELRFADRAGAAYLRRLEGSGVALTGTSPLIAEMLRRPGTRR